MDEAEEVAVVAPRERPKREGQCKESSLCGERLREREGSN
jgi:hypothetical protein